MQPAGLITILCTMARATNTIADQGKTKDYNNLGFSVNYVPSLGKQQCKTVLGACGKCNKCIGYNPVYGTIILIMV